jgi:regulator of sirC expression with transglutaminase-like and TPR domain
MENRARLAEVMRGPDPDLVEANLLIAAEGRPGVDPSRWLDEVDRLATLTVGADAQSVFDTLRDAGFLGDTRGYDDPRNSFLDEVLRRRRGLPIALSALTVGIGRRIGASIEGIAMPGHYIVADTTGGHVRYVDPFHGWAPRTVGELAGIAGESAGVQLEPGHLAPAPPQVTVTRMLLNLEGSYRRRERLDDVLWCCELLALVNTEDPAPRVRVAEVLVELGRPDEAEALLGSLLTTTPPGLAMQVAESVLADIRGARLN